MPTRFTVEQHADSLANFLPEGRAWAAKKQEGTQLNSLLKGLAPEYKRINDLFCTFLEQLDPRTTDNFLVEWERLLGIPDDCIPLSTDIQERRDNIVLKLASLSIVTEEDFINLGDQFGITITISHLSDTGFPPHAVPHSPTSDLY